MCKQTINYKSTATVQPAAEGKDFPHKRKGKIKANKINREELVRDISAQSEQQIQRKALSLSHTLSLYPSF